MRTYLRPHTTVAPPPHMEGQVILECVAMEELIATLATAWVATPPTVAPPTGLTGPYLPGLYPGSGHTGPVYWPRPSTVLALGQPHTMVGRATQRNPITSSLPAVPSTRKRPSPRRTGARKVRTKQAAATRKVITTLTVYQRMARATQRLLKQMASQMGLPLPQAMGRALTLTQGHRTPPQKAVAALQTDIHMQGVIVPAWIDVPVVPMPLSTHARTPRRTPITHRF